jgi:hypothetical protein
MNDAPFVFVIVLNYNGRKYLKDCLSSLASQTYANCGVIVCDNASTDNSIKYIKRNFPSTIIIRNKKNLGFAKGNNVAIKFALKEGADYVFLLNNDTILEKDLIERLIKVAMTDNKIGIVGPKILDIRNPSLVHEVGMTCDIFGFPIAIRQQESGKQTISEVFYVSGCAMLIKQEVLNKVGLFDEEYFMFAEDLDLCWRAQLTGYLVFVDRAARVYHASGGSITGGIIKERSYSTNVRRIFLREKNTLRTLIKNYSIGNLIKIIPFYLALLLMECIIWTFFLKPNVCICLLKAVGWNIKVLPDTIRYRQRVQRLRNIADQRIMKKIAHGRWGKLQVFRLVKIPYILDAPN